MVKKPPSPRSGWLLHFFIAYCAYCHGCGLMRSTCFPGMTT
jgi:hypothetical protein